MNSAQRLFQQYRANLVVEEGDGRLPLRLDLGGPATPGEQIPAAADCLRSWARSPFHRGPWASGKARHKPDQIATIVQSLIINGLIAGGIGRAFDQKDRAAGRHL